MEIAELKKKVIEVIANQAGKKIEEIKPETRIADLGLDQLDSVEAIMDLEEKLDIETSDEEVEKLETLDDLVAYTYTLIEKKEAKPKDEETKEESNDNPTDEPKTEPETNDK
jgi:acyl carrier protein